MKRTIFLIVALLMIFHTSSARKFNWACDAMDGSRTGCVAPSVENVKEALGSFDGSTYIAPNGKRFSGRTSVARMARCVIDAQPAMARVKEIIGYSTKVMNKAYPESPLTNWFIDLYMEEVSRMFGVKVDIGVANFGGVRVDMPQGDIQLDDILSMFPFKNKIAYIEHKGLTIRKMLESMAEDGFQILGGVRVVAENGRLVQVEVGGEPLDDERIYGVVSNSFLLQGGDGLYLARDAVDMKIFEYDLKDAVLEGIRRRTASGQPLSADIDGRVVIR